MWCLPLTVTGPGNGCRVLALSPPATGWPSSGSCHALCGHGNSGPGEGDEEPLELAEMRVPHSEEGPPAHRGV